VENLNMNGKQKIALTATMVAVVIIALAASIHYLTATMRQSSLLPSGEPPTIQLQITGELASPKTLTINDLSKMPLTNVTHTIKGENANYVGVTLLELLNQTGASWDAGYINVIADGYNRTVNLYQVYNSTQYPGNEVILAFVKDGKWITDTSEGPLKLITPGLASAYNVKSVLKINLQPWTINVTGAVSTPLLLTGQNITSFETKTVHATFAPTSELQRTSDWTGVTLSSVLQASGVSVCASKVTVTAIDGYSKDYTINQANDLGILIGYKENGAYLTPVNGQPFRLVVPTEDYKWGQFWVRWVFQITIS
jgi:DMSO/TMAO reductase YedYZ molybdopterin-dependent catalytic subunit